MRRVRSAISARLRIHIWIIGTGSAAALVFLVTFLAVDAATGTTTPAPAAFVADAALDHVPATIPGAPDDDTTLDPAAETEDLSVRDPLEDAAEVVVSVEAARPLPEFDEAALILGGTGAEGAILAGVGIVPSSGVQNTTAWELLIPSARLRASIVRVGITASNAFGAPDNPFVIGWWADGPAPGQSGNVLLDGHRDFRDSDGNLGTGVCWELPNTSLGDFIIVRDNDARQNYLYSVVETTSIPFDAPEGAAYLASSALSRLTLVTCEGSFDAGAHNYSNRRIVVAELEDTIPFASS